ncbi:DNA topoisomerase IV subunit B [bacterium]|nr:DNA topoisomerase IV subunit B [bacterium]
MAKTSGKKGEYTAGQIQVLQGLEAVRKRPAMYIGDTSSGGLHHLVWEVLDNAIDEAMAGECTKIVIELIEDGSCRVTDNGRGIPVDIHKGEGVPAVELVLGRLHAGGKFDAEAYKVSGGLHGVGVSCVNALSSSLIATIHRDGGRHEITFERGSVTKPLKKTGKNSGRGTTIQFIPDPEIFREGTRFNRRTLQKRIKELAYLNKGLSIQLIDGRKDEEEALNVTYLFEGGISEYVQELVQNAPTLLNEPFFCHETVPGKGESSGVEVEVSFQYFTQRRGETLSFVNNIRTHNGGTHVTGLNMAITGAIKKYMTEYRLEEKGLKIDGESIRYGLQAVLAVRLHEPQFEGQTKGKLGTTAAKGAVQTAVWGTFYRWLEQNPSEAKKIVLLTVTIAKATQKAKKAFELERNKEVFGSGVLPGKLTDCILKDPSRTELFIVEGDSAGGNTKQGREAEFQAVLPLRGKILNVEKVISEERLLSNVEIKALIQAVGVGYCPEADYLPDRVFEDLYPTEDAAREARAIKRTFPVSEMSTVARGGMALDKLRYNKIIIMTDADVDGAHITTLLLTFFYRRMYPLLEDGHIYVAQPPLYKVRAGKDERYVADDREKEAVMEELADKNPVVQRFKGLGEMDAIELWDTTMDPDKRTLHRVQIVEAEEAESVFQTLMGKDVESRKRFIERNATKVMNLDV